MGGLGRFLAAPGLNKDRRSSRFLRRVRRHRQKDPVQVPLASRTPLRTSGTSAGLQGEWLSYVHPQDSRHIKSRDPISPLCDCLTCTTYSLGYLHHLFKVNDSLYLRLATIHNLRFMSQLMERLAALPRD